MLPAPLPTEGMWGRPPAHPVTCSAPLHPPHPTASARPPARPCTMLLSAVPTGPRLRGGPCRTPWGQDGRVPAPQCPGGFLSLHTLDVLAPPFCSTAPCTLNARQHPAPPPSPEAVPAFLTPPMAPAPTGLCPQALPLSSPRPRPRPQRNGVSQDGGGGWRVRSGAAGNAVVFLGFTLHSVVCSVCRAVRLLVLGLR